MASEKLLESGCTDELEANPENKSIRLQQTISVLIFYFLGKLKFTVHNKFSNWKQYFFICFANGRFYVYLKRNLIAFEFVSVLLSGGISGGRAVL